MNNLEKLIKDFETGETLPLIGTFMASGESCGLCAARTFCNSSESDEMGCADTRAYWLIMEYVEPDSIEKIQADAKKRFTDYWGCIDCCCQDCPAMVNGKTPDERFNVDNCCQAHSLDIHRRLSELDAF